MNNDDAPKYVLIALVILFAVLMARGCRFEMHVSSKPSVAASGPTYADMPDCKPANFVRGWTPCKTEKDK